MNLLRLKPSTIACALFLILSQGAGAAIIAGALPQSEADAFNFGKKKNESGEAAGAKGEKTDAEGGEDSKSKLKGKAEKDEEPPKEKHMSKEEIAEEEALEAEYAEYQKQLKDLLKTVKTPFGANDGKAEKIEESELSPMSISGSGSDSGSSSGGHQGHITLGTRLQKPKVYMPGHMVIGRPAEFTIKGRPGYWAALAMADRDSGAKPIFGQAIRLGPDRKVIALGKIPVSGVLVLKMFAPVAGDLIGGKIYFEGAVWPENNPEHLELAVPVSSDPQVASTANGVVLTGQGERKHGIKFVPEARSPYSRINGPGLGSGSPL